MRRRAEQVDETRLRITEAAVRLHTTVGPSKTTVTTVADEAGVTRLTVYRHFADQDELFDACRRHWFSLNPPPNEAAWLAIPDLEDRGRRAISEMYAWYRAHGAELFPIYRDVASMPRRAQEAIQAEWAARADAVIEGIGVTPLVRRRLRAVTGHLLALMTWRSLVVEQGLSDEEAVDIAVGLLCSTASGSRRTTTTLPRDRPARIG